MLSSKLCCTSDKAYKVQDGGDDAEDDEPPGLGAEHAHPRQQGGHGAQPRGEAAAGARQEGGDGARREGEEAEVFFYCTNGVE